MANFVCQPGTIESVYLSGTQRGIRHELLGAAPVPILEKRLNKFSLAEERERDKERETDRDREREIKREKERISFFFLLLLLLPVVKTLSVMNRSF